jgi:hypothetical protein
MGVEVVSDVRAGVQLVGLMKTLRSHQNELHTDSNLRFKKK